MADGKWYVSDKKSDLPWTEHEYFYDEGRGWTNYSQIDSTYDTSGLLVSRREYSSDFIATTTYKYDNNDTLLSSTTTAGDNFITRTCTYDRSGNLITQQNYEWGTAEPTDLYQYSYDNNGNQASEVCYYKGTLAEVNTYSYDKNGNKTEAVSFNSEGPSYTDKYVYDEVGNILSEKHYRADGELYATYSYKYDDRGNMIERSRMNSDNEVAEVQTYFWNHEGQKEQVRWKVKPYDGDLDSATEWTQNYIYDEAGNVVGIDVYEGRELQDKSIYAYDANGNRTLSEEYYLKNGEEKFLHKWEYGYDDTGALVARWDYDDDGTLVKNWSAKEMIFGGQTYTFNANELLNIVTSLGSSSTNFSSVLSSIASTCGSIAGTVSSADSGLSGTLNKLADVCNTCDTQISKLLTNLSNDINSYVTKTVAGEEAATDQLADINANIWDAEQVMNSLAGE